MRTEVYASILTWVQLQWLVQGFHLRNLDKISTKETGRRILYGNAVDPKDFPFLVKIVHGMEFCSGTIIYNHWVMTAAHCVYESECRLITLYPAVAPRQDLYPTECYVHPKFVLEGFRYDISLLKLSDDLIVGNERAQLIPLPDPDWIYPPGTQAIVVGWGKKEDGTYSSELLTASVRVQDWAGCDRDLGQFVNPSYSTLGLKCENIGIRNICTKGEQPQPGGPCLGDSGGPLIVDNHVIGVVSVVIQEENTNKCIDGAPSIYVSVLHYQPWIYSIMSKSVFSVK